MKKQISTILIILICVTTIYLFNRPFTETFPVTDFGIVKIITESTESSSRKVEDSITIPIEKSLKNIDEIKTFVTTTIPGRSEIEIHSKENTSIELFKKISEQVSKVGLPINEKPKIKSMNTNDSPILEVAITKSNSSFETVNEVCNKLQNKIQPKINQFGKLKCIIDNKKVNGKSAAILTLTALMGQDQISLVKKIQKELSGDLDTYGLIFLNNSNKYLLEKLFNNLLIFFFFLLVAGIILFFINRSVILNFALSFTGIIVFSILVLNLGKQSFNIISSQALNFALPLILLSTFYFINFSESKENSFSAKKRRLFIVSVGLLLFSFLCFPFLATNGIFGKFISRGVYTVLVLLAVCVLFLLPYTINDISHSLEGNKIPSEKIYQFFNYFTKTRFWVFLSFASLLLIFMLTIVLITTQGKFKLFPDENPTNYRFVLKANSQSQASVIENEIIRIENILQNYNQEIEFYVSLIGKIKKDENDPYALYGQQFAQISIRLNERTKEENERFINHLKTSITPPNNIHLELEKLNFAPPKSKPISIELSGENKERLQETSKIYLEKLSSLSGVINPELSHPEYDGEYLRRRDFSPILEIVADLDEKVTAKRNVHSEIQLLEKILPTGIQVKPFEDMEMEKNTQNTSYAYLISLGLMFLTTVLLAFYYSSPWPVFIGLIMPFLSISGPMIINIIFGEYISLYTIIIIIVFFPVTYLGFLVLLENIRNRNSVILGAIDSISVNFYLPAGIALLGLFSHFFNYRNILPTELLSFSGAFIYHILFLGFFLPIILHFLPFGIIKKNK